MKKFMLLAVVALGLAACASVGPYPDGRVFEGSVTYGAYDVPLPEGRWTVFGKSETPDSARFRLGLLALGRFRADGIVEQVITIDTVLAYGSRRAGSWTLSRTCEREDMLYVKKVANTMSARDCTFVNHVTPSSFSEGSVYGRLVNALRKRGAAIPANAIAVVFDQADSMNRLIVTVAFNPEADGLPPSPDPDWSDSEWNPRNINGFPERKAYVDKVIAWTQEWEPRIKAAFGRTRSR